MTTTEDRPDTGAPAPKTPRSRPALIALPLLFTVAIVLFFVQLGPAGIFPGNFPPVEDLSFGRVTLDQDQIKIVVTNGGPSEATISQVIVEDAFWDFTSDVDGPIGRLKSATLTIPYPWVDTEPVNIRLVTSTGVTFDHLIDVATKTPAVDGRFLMTFALIGIYIGLIPVLVGLTWKPFLATLSRRWLNFFLAFTAGVLVILAFETLDDAVAEAAALPSAFGGVGIVVLGAALAFVATFLIGRRFRGRKGTDPAVVTAFTVAAGIGIHNLGEGLAVGAAYRLGEIALGTFLVIGFAIHNTTEGLGIVSILGRRKVSIGILLLLGAVAGLPTVLGAWAGAFFFSPTLATVFLAIAAGAIAQVLVEVLGVVKRSDGGLTSLEALGGVATGIAVMFLTGVFVAA